ncbi:MAG TPA: hypothetical protein VG273_08115 [Bryobacteraceae bacterium]|nr:hypothetical protein [Bryobacteraceae bacterium]
MNGNQTHKLFDEQTSPLHHRWHLCTENPMHKFGNRYRGEGQINSTMRAKDAFDKVQNRLLPTLRRDDGAGIQH